jgi:hypothetical protein
MRSAGHVTLLLLLIWPADGHVDDPGPSKLPAAKLGATNAMVPRSASAAALE